MTCEMPRLNRTPAGVRLCLLNEMPIDGARNFVLQMKDGRFHGFVIRKGAEVFGYLDRCPHAGLPLAQKLDSYLTPDGQAIQCSWHGALFRVDDGACVGGPCSGALTSWAVSIAEEWIVTS